MTYALFALSGVALLVLRVLFGLIFVIHGWPKIKDLRANAKSFDSMGFRPGIVWGTLFAVLEFIGGLALIVGLFTQILGLLMAILMLIAIFNKVKNKHPFIGGYELYIALFAMGLILATSGGGIFALENMQSFLLY